MWGLFVKKPAAVWAGSARQQVLEEVMSGQPVSVWDEERLAKLKQLWAEGMSVTRIGIALGVTRNAVVGKAQRIGLPRRKSPIPELKDPGVAGRRRSLQTVARQWVRTRCSWPLGDPQSGDFRFCGEPVSSGRPYCEHHCEQAYNTGALRTVSTRRSGSTR